MGLIFFIIFFYGLTIAFYLLAHRMPNKKWLSVYSVFWLTVLAFGIYDIVIATNTSNGKDDFSLAWVVVAGFLFSSCYVSIIGIIGRSVVLYLTYRGRQNIKMPIVHFVSFLSVMLLPSLIQIFTVLILLIKLLLEKIIILIF